VFADEREVELLSAVRPGARLSICDLTAPMEILKQRVIERQPTEGIAVGCADGLTSTTLDPITSESGYSR
jgi:hypothetical protein